MATMLIVATVLARRLSLAEFGVYGLSLSFSTYLLFAQGSVEATAIKRLAETRDAEAAIARSRPRSPCTSLTAWSRGSSSAPPASG